jgi:phosphoribosylglycinamide formyltransferase-1
MVYKIGWFSSGRDEAARQLLMVVHDSIQKGFIKAKFDFVFSNRERGQDAESDVFFDIVDRLGIELVCFSSKTFEPELRKNDIKEWRRAYDKKVIAYLYGFDPDLCVLAGYMLITGEKLCNRFTMINLHPAEPSGPTGTWQEVIWELIKIRSSRTGVMMHLVTEELDRGPPITYCTYSIRGGSYDPLWAQMEEKLKTGDLEKVKQLEGENEPLFAKIRREGVKRELPLIIQTIKVFEEGMVRVENRKVIAEGKVIPAAYDVTDRIEALLITMQPQK